MNFNSMNENYLAKICLASVCTLLAIWVLPNTIVIRHVLLGIGFISGACLIQKNWASFNKFTTTLIPLYAILALFLWVAIHYVFFSLNPTLELSEIRGLWMRTLAGTITAIGLGIALSKNPNLRKYFYISLFFVPFINLSAYLYLCVQKGAILPVGSSIFFVYAKIETAYFGALAASLAIAEIIYLLFLNKVKYSLYQVGLYFLGIVLVLVSAIVSSTKNGVAITLGLCALLTMTIGASVVFNSRQFKKISLFLLPLITGLFFLAWQVHHSTAAKGWDSLFQDVKVSADIDKNRQWQSREGMVVAPLNASGNPAALNTYSRVAYAVVGIRLIGQYPLGYGSINKSFNGLQDEAQIYHEHTGQVHSGWIDFGLGFGLPGLGLLFSALICIIYFGIKRGGEINLVVATYCLTLIPLGLIAEICYKQYFEATIFFIAFAATAIAVNENNKEKLFDNYGS